MSGIKSSAELSRRFARVGLGLFLISPYLLWAMRVHDWAVIPWHVWWPPFLNGVIQSLMSAAGALSFGALMWLGFSGSAWAEIILLVPNMLPPIFVILSWIALTVYPQDLWGVVAVHVLINSGLVVVALARGYERRLGSLAEASLVMGATRVQFFREVAWPLWRAELGQLFLLLFTLAFTSFSVPLLLTHSRQVTLEVAIYDLIRVEGEWGQALLLALAQTVGLWILVWLWQTPSWPAARARPFAYRVRGLAPLIVLPTCILFAGLLPSLSYLPQLSSELLSAVMMSLALGLVTGLLHFVGFLIVAWIQPHLGLERFLAGYLAPSAVLTGFAWLGMPGPRVLVTALALTVLSFPLLYRWTVGQALKSLEAQVGVARTLGASWSQITWDVVWPQAAPAILRASGLAAVWAAGDFALSGILLEATSLPLMISDFLGTYRIDQAQGLLWPLLITCMLVYLFFVKVGRYVAG